MTKISDLHRRWSKDPDYKDAYDALGEEFDLARALRGADGCRPVAVTARSPHEDLAVIHRADRGRQGATITEALERFAQATRTRLRIVFEPEPARRFNVVRS
jgi:hypothetical protein